MKQDVRLADVAEASWNLTENGAEWGFDLLAAWRVCGAAAQALHVPVRGRIAIDRLRVVPRGVRIVVRSCRGFAPRF